MSRSLPASAQTRRERRAAARLERVPKHRSRARSANRSALRSPMVLVTLAAVAIGLGVVAFALPKEAPREELRMPPTSYEAGLADGDVLGAADAPVLLEVYADFQCPACRLFVTTQLERLTNDFVRPGFVRIQARDIAILGRGSFDESLELAVGAACAAQQDRYWQFHDLVFWNQGRENRGDHDAGFVAQVADQAMGDRSAWDACVAGDEQRDAIRSATAQALGAGIGSTPTLVVGGERIVGVPDYEQLAAKIRAQAGIPVAS